MPETVTTPISKEWHAKRLKEAAAASRDLMRWSLYLNGHRTFWERITGEFKWKNR